MALASRRWDRAITFWTLMAGIVLIAATTTVGHLAPALFAPPARDTLGLVGLGLFLAAHVACLCLGFRQPVEDLSIDPAPVLQFVESEA